MFLDAFCFDVLYEGGNLLLCGKKMMKHKANWELGKLAIYKSSKVKNQVR